MSSKSSSAADKIKEKAKELLAPWKLLFRPSFPANKILRKFAIFEDVAITAELLRMCPNPLKLDSDNYSTLTPLHLAVIKDQPNIIRKLLIAGADPTIRDCNGNTPLHLACIFGSPECLHALTTPIIVNEIYEAYRYNRSNDITDIKFTKLPLGLEMPNNDGERCVHIAANDGDIDLLRILVACGADINNAKEEDTGRTPYIIGVEHCDEELLYYLFYECEAFDLEAAEKHCFAAYQRRFIEKRKAELSRLPKIDYNTDEHAALYD